MPSIICESMPSDRVAMVNQHALRATTEFSLFTTITASDYIISKIQQLQNKFIRLALRLPKYICSKLLHDSTVLPYVKVDSSPVQPSPQIELHKTLWSGSQYLPTGSILLGIVSQCHHPWSVL